MGIEQEVYNLFKSAIPNVPSIVPHSLPIPFFGRYKTAQAATISLNPSDKEFLDRNGNWLLGSQRRFESYKSLDCSSNLHLSDEMLTKAHDCCLEYFEKSTAYWNWFSHIESPISKATNGKLSYRNGSLAHFDLSPWATNPVWSGLSDKEKNILKTDGLAFLKWLIGSSTAKVYFLNGRTTCETIIHEMFDKKIVWNPLADRWKYFSMTASIQGKDVTLFGWNLYLQQSGQSSLLVQKISEELDKLA